MTGINIYRTIIEETQDFFHHFERPASIDKFCEPIYPAYLLKAIDDMLDYDVVGQSIEKLFEGYDYVETDLGPACQSILGVEPKIELKLWRTNKCSRNGVDETKVQGTLTYKRNGQRRELAIFYLRSEHVPKDL